MHQQAKRLAQNPNQYFFVFQIETTAENTNGNGVGPEEIRDEYPTTPPPPFPPVGRKRDIYVDVRVFESVDQTAISVAQAEQKTFTDLVRALTLHARNDVDKARYSRYLSVSIFH